jgi:DNA-binding NtrC family response regulator
LVESKPSVVIVSENEDTNNLLSGVFWLKGMITYKAHDSDECLNKINNLNGKVDAVVMSDEIAGDRTAKLIINIKTINQSTKILVIGGEQSNKTRILDYGADEFALRPISAENVADKIFNLLVKRQLV